MDICYLLTLVKKLDILHKANERIRAIQKGELGAITPLQTIEKKKKIKKKEKVRRRGKIENFNRS